MKSFSLFMGLFAAVLMMGSGLAHAQQPKDVVAVVGTKTITLEEFNKKYSDIRSQTQNPPSKEQFLEDLVRYEVGLQEAEKRKLQNDPSVQEQMRQQLYKALLEKDLGEKVQKISVSEKEMREFYKKNPEIRTSHILIEVKPGATPEQRAAAKKRAGEIYTEVKSSKRPFEELVKLYSDDPLSKQAGGDVGWQSRMTLVPSYYNAVVKMKVGELNGLIETPFGYHIVKVTGRRAYENANKRQVRAAVFDEKRKEIFDQYFNRLEKSVKIQENKKLIE